MNTFKIAQPRSIEQVTALLSANNANYYLMAGGTDLLDELKNEIIQPDIIIDLKTVADLSYIKKDNNGVFVGALTTVSELAANTIIKNDYPGLHQAALSLASPQLRNVGTVGGNLCQRPRCWYYRDQNMLCRKKGGGRCYARNGRNRYHAIFGGGMCYIVYPSDLAPALIALGAEVTIASSKKQKSIPLEDFYTLPSTDVKKENILNSDEMIKEIKIPLNTNGVKSHYFKLKERGTWDFAVVSAAISGKISGNVFSNINIVLGGVAPIPWRLKNTEDFIKTKTISENMLKQATHQDLEEARPLPENEFKKDLLTAVVSRAVRAML